MIQLTIRLNLTWAILILRVALSLQWVLWIAQIWLCRNSSISWWCDNIRWIRYNTYQIYILRWSSRLLLDFWNVFWLSFDRNRTQRNIALSVLTSAKSLCGKRVSWLDYRKLNRNVFYWWWHGNINSFLCYMHWCSNFTDLSIRMGNVWITLGHLSSTFLSV